MLTIQEIIQRAPAAAATHPAKHCTDRYVMVPTIQMVEALHGVGYVPVAARQDNARPDRWGTEKHVRHMVKLRMPGTEKLSVAAKMAGAVPELILLNSSDGSCPFQLKLGVWRQVCSNGMIAQVTIAAVNQVHRNVTAEEVIARAKALSAQSKPLFDKIAAWSKIRLNDLAQQRFAEQAMVLRIGEERAKHYSTAAALAVRRPEDEAPTLWNIFNRVQEAAMKGLIDGQKAGRALHMRPLIGIQSDVEFNESLWSLGEKWAALGGVK